MGKSDKKSKKKHKSKRKEHKEKHKDKARKSKRQPKEEESPPRIEEASPAAATSTAAPATAPDSGSEDDFAIPIALMNSKSHAPETPEEYQRRQSQIRREVDPVTGRTRLIKGDSEILEEIVSKQRHVDINKKATTGDGEYYEAQSFAAAAAKRRKPK